MPSPSKGAYSKSDHQKASKAETIARLQSADRNLLKQYGVEKLDILEIVTNGEDPSIKQDTNNEDKKSALEKYTINLLDLAIKNKIDPLIGRNDEVQRLMQVLCRRKKKYSLTSSNDVLISWHRQRGRFEPNQSFLG